MRGWRESGLSSCNHYGTSYTANAVWFADTWPDWDSESIRCEAQSAGPLLRPISCVPNPANTVYYMENAGRFAWLLETGEFAGNGVRAHLDVSGLSGACADPESRTTSPYRCFGKFRRRRLWGVRLFERFQSSVFRNGRPRPRPVRFGFAQSRSVTIQPMLRGVYIARSLEQATKPAGGAGRWRSRL
jgi:hypothetical protein